MLRVCKSLTFSAVLTLPIFSPFLSRSFLAVLSIKIVFPDFAENIKHRKFCKCQSFSNDFHYDREQRIRLKLTKNQFFGVKIKKELFILAPESDPTVLSVYLNFFIFKNDLMTYQKETNYCQNTQL